MASEPTQTNPTLARLMASIEQNARRREAASADIAKAEAELREQAARRLAGFAANHLTDCGVDVTTASAAARARETPALAWLRDWLTGPKPFAVLRGGFGTGKSVAAAWSLLQARRWVRTMAHPLADEPVAFQEYDHRRGLWLTAARLHYAPRFVDGKSESLVDRAATVAWLVLDELRAEDTKGAGLERLEEVLGERHAMSRRTVITSNLTLDAMREALGGRLGSRLAEAAAIFDSGSDDMRRQR